jgi:hypothetical protein
MIDWAFPPIYLFVEYAKGGSDEKRRCIVQNKSLFLPFYFQ